MDRSSFSQNPLIAAVLTAEAAVLAATTPEQYREAERALMTAGVALSEKVKQRHAWLERNWERLREYDLTLPPVEVKAKEDIWMTKCAEYEAMMSCLARALTVVSLPGPSEPVTPEAPAMTQGGLL